MPSLRSPSAPPSTSSDRSADVIRVAVVDDHPPIREAIRRAAEESMDVRIVAETGSVGEASRLIEEHEPDVAVVDLSLRDGHGFELLKSVRAQHLDTRLVVYSLHDETVYAERALRAGASGYLMKGGSTADVLAAVRRVAAGEVYLSPEMKRRVLPAMRSDGEEEVHFPIDELTDRELHVFRTMGRGLTANAIADRLGIARKTVDTHRRRIKEKLGYQTTDEVVAHAARWVLGTTDERGRP
jgi:DNA-binding NarL/FixJ family response regulator